MTSPAIADITAEFEDNQRRGPPKPGCDCMQCFGYCLVDQDVYAREMALRNETKSPESIPARPITLEGWDE